MTPFILSQIFGGVAACVIILSFQFKNVRGLLLIQILSSVLFGAQFLLLGAYSGLYCNLLGLLLRIVVYFRSKHGSLPGENKEANALCSPYAWLFALLFFAIGILTYDGPSSLLPCASMAIFTFALWDADARKLRLLNFFLCCPMWLAYNICTGAIAGIVTESFNILSIAVSWFRFFRTGQTVKGVSGTGTKK